MPSPSPKKEEGTLVAEKEALKDEEEKKEVVLAKIEMESSKEETTTTAPSNQMPSKALPSANAFVSGSNMNGGCTMTGGGRPSSRVLAPPGGHTSIKLG